MNFDDQQARIDSIALDFERDWNIDQSGDLLVRCYSILPCDELLSYLVSADCELALKHGIVRNADYYLSIFPDQIALIRLALSQGDASDFGESTGVHEDSFIEAVTQFFPILPYQFGKYRVVRFIGQGGMASVFEAEVDDQKVALKIPYCQARNLGRLATRFQKEIQLLSKLRHPHIVSVIEHGEIDGLNYFTMPLLDGEGLDEKCTLDRFETLSPVQAAAYILQATEAIAYSHDVGILHRDIKPANILVDRRDHVWVVDFGLATASDASLRTTYDGRLLGTPTWMPPEQACGNHSKVDERSDVYSLGATLYTLLTGRAPFAGATTEQLLQNIQCQELTPPRHLFKRVPKSLQTIVMACMEKNPQRRYSKAQDLAADLTAFLQDRKIHAREPSSPVKAYRWFRLYPRQTTAALGIVTTLAISVVGILMLRHVASLQQHIAANAEAGRLAAEKSELEQRLLRVLSDKERMRAIDAANYAQAQQMRTAFTEAESSLKLKHYGKPAQLFQYPSRQCIDTEWYYRQLSLAPRNLGDFCTGDWGLYDIAIDSQRKLLATIGREGDIGVWDLQNKRLIKYLKFAERDPDRGYALNRWRHKNNLLDGFTANGQPDFYSSVSWMQNGNLLVAGLNGELNQFSLDDAERKVLLTSAASLYWVRSNADRSQFLVVDEIGGSTLLGASGEVIFQTALDLRPTWAGFATEFDTWLVASATGDLIFLNRGLIEIGRLSTGARIVDVRVVFGDSSQLLILSESKPPQLYALAKSENRISHKLVQEFVHQGNSPPPNYDQALYDKRTNQVVAIDDSGMLSTWKLDNNDSSTFDHLVCNKDIRRPRKDDLRASDLLERRSRYFLLESSDGIATIDCSGTFREFDFADINHPPSWKQLDCTVGPDARIAADPSFPDRFWSLDNSGSLRYISLSQNKLLAEHIGAHSGGYADLQVRSNGDVFTAGNDAELRVWQYRDGSIKQKSVLRHANPLLSVAIQENGELVASVDSEARVILFDLTTGKIRNSFPTAQPNNNSPIYSGRLAFSESGKYLTAFGRGQDCKSFDIEQLTECRSASFSIAYQGGHDIAHSPTFEHRYLTSSNAVSANEIESSEFFASSEVLLAGCDVPAVDFEITEDRQRVVALLNNGNIIFFSPDHFVQLSMLASPTPNPSSLTISKGDPSLIVAAKDGMVSYCTLAAYPINQQYTRTLERRVRNVQGVEALSYLRLADFNGLRAVQDQFGHLAVLFTAGGASSKSQLNQLYVLEKDNDVWRIRRLRFDGDDCGPCEYASLHATSQGSMFAIIRQGHASIDGYDGRLLLAHESQEKWNSEVLRHEGNAGFYPFPVLAGDGSVKSVLHFDHERLRFFAHHRGKELNSWKQETIAGFLGFATNGVRDSLGITHFISRHSRGFDSSPPHKYFQIGSAAEIKFENAKGEYLLTNQNADVFSYEADTGFFWLKSLQGGWEAIDQVPFNHMACRPTLDKNNQIWFAFCTGTSILLGTRDMSDLKGKKKMPWRVFRLNLDKQFSRSASCVCNLNSSGVLEILLSQVGDSTKLGIVEVKIAEF